MPNLIAFVQHSHAWLLSLLPTFKDMAIVALCLLMAFLTGLLFTRWRQFCHRLRMVHYGCNASKEDDITFDPPVTDAAGSPATPPPTGKAQLLAPLGYLKRTASRLLRDEHDEIAFKVFRRLRLRHAQLKEVERETNSYQVQGELEDIYWQAALNNVAWQKDVVGKIGQLGIITGGQDYETLCNREALWLELLLETSSHRMEITDALRNDLKEHITHDSATRRSEIKGINQRILSIAYPRESTDSALLIAAQKDGIRCEAPPQEQDYQLQPDLWLLLLIAKHYRSRRLSSGNLPELYKAFLNGGSRNPADLNNQVCKIMFPEDSPKDSKAISPQLRAYRLAVTDLFVEKALGYLEKQAKGYAFGGKIAYFFALAVVIFGTLFAFTQMLGINIGRPDNSAFIKELESQTKGPLDLVSSHLLQPGIKQRQAVVLMSTDSVLTFDQKAMLLYHVPFWQYGLLAFTRAFTAYGMLVLIAVGLWRFGKAMLDQAERLMERRHALRQGRLFVHLNDGQLTIDQMDKAFNWNVSQTNAFAQLLTEAQAPWGTVAKETVRATPEIIKAVGSLTGKAEK